MITLVLSRSFNFRRIIWTILCAPYWNYIIIEEIELRTKLKNEIEKKYYRIDTIKDGVLSYSSFGWFFMNGFFLHL